MYTLLFVIIEFCRLEKRVVRARQDKYLTLQYYLYIKCPTRCIYVFFSPSFYNPFAFGYFNLNIKIPPTYLYGLE